MELIELPTRHWAYKNAPTRCPNGHEFGPRQVFISTSPATGLVWECGSCHVKIYKADLG